MRRYQVAMVAACPFPANYGSSASIIEMSTALAGRGHQMHVVTYHLGLPIESPPFKIHRIPNLPTYKKMDAGPAYQKPLLDLLLAMKLTRVVRGEKIDLLHAHNYEATLAAYIARRLTGVPVVYNAVTNMVHELPTYNFIRPRWLAVKLAEWLDKFVPRHADQVTAVTPDLVDYIASKGVPAEKITLIPAGVNLEDFRAPDPERVRRAHRLDDRPTVIYTGVLDNFQGLEYLLEAMQTVVKQMPQAALLVAANSDPSKYQAMAREMGLAQHVVFVHNPPFRDIKHLLAAAQVAVIPRPQCPGFPVKLLNYMATGKAIVSFAGSAKCIDHLKSGWVVPGADVLKFAEGILTLLRDNALAQRLGAAARESLNGNYEWRALAGKVEKVYEKVLGGLA